MSGPACDGPVEQAEASPALLSDRFACDPRYEQVKGVVYDTHTGAVKQCLFCNIIDRKESGAILLENHEFTVFKSNAFMHALCYRLPQ